MEEEHLKKTEQLQKQMKELASQKGQASLKFGGQSNTTRSKSYKNLSRSLDFSVLNEIVQIDPKKRIARVEPRVTMESLIKATLQHGLIPPVVPEFKGITVGGAIMGAAAESGSHKWGCFNDNCVSHEILLGDGSLIHASPSLNQDVFYGVAGSYGSLGALTLTELQLIPAKDAVHLRYHTFSDPREAVKFISKLSHDPAAPDFLDGIVFSTNLAVVIEGWLKNKENLPSFLPEFTFKSASSDWYYHHVEKIGSNSGGDVYEEMIPIHDYLFRYDQGAFWVGTCLFKPGLLARFICQGVFKIQGSAQRGFSEEEVQNFRHVSCPNKFWRAVSHSLMDSQSLYGMLHKAEEWVQERIVIQDFCIPEEKAEVFFEETLKDPGVFPIWLCPIRGTRTPQIFAPHLLEKFQKGDLFINFGIYGIPAYSAPTSEIIQNLERSVKVNHGRKVLYCYSYYNPDEFWQIYSREAYQTLREKMAACGVWNDITDKVLSK